VADGVTITSGANSTLPDGTKFATDELGGGLGHLPLVGIAYSDSSGTQVTANASGLAVQGTTTLSGVSAASATTTNVGDSASSVTLLASNSSRVGWSITNMSSAVLYVKLGATATTTDSFIARLVQYDRVGQGPLDGLYTGLIAGIWASDAGGVAVITEW
jgi:hypothetical protein